MASYPAPKAQSPKPSVDHPLRRFRQPAILFGVVVLYGVAGYTLIEGWHPLDALYMTITTIATVGYREVEPLSRAGELFTMSLIIGGVATMLYAFGIFAEMLNDEHFIRYQHQRRTDRALARLRDHFIICGYGRIGTQIAREFETDGVAFVVLDINPEAVERLEAEARLYVIGDDASEEVLLRAGIDRARGLISAVDSDERAVYITLAARAMRPDLFILARAGKPESIRRLELAGADRVVSPYRMAGHQMAEMALRPALVDVMDTIRHGGVDVGVEELLVQSGSSAIGLTLGDAGLLAPDVARLLALRRADGALHVNPGPALPLAEGDLLVVLGTSDELIRMSALVQ